jgi:hypothetical protein
MGSLTRFFLRASLLIALTAPVRASNHESLIEGAKKEASLVLYTSMTVDQAQKLNFVADDISSGDDYNKNYEQFRNIFGAPKQ